MKQNQLSAGLSQSRCYKTFCNIHRKMCVGVSSAILLKRDFKRDTYCKYRESFKNSLFYRTRPKVAFGEINRIDRHIY